MLFTSLSAWFINTNLHLPSTGNQICYLQTSYHSPNMKSSFFSILALPALFIGAIAAPAAAPEAAIEKRQTADAYSIVSSLYSDIMQYTGAISKHALVKLSSSPSLTIHPQTRLQPVSPPTLPLLRMPPQPAPLSPTSKQSLLRSTLLKWRLPRSLLPQISRLVRPPPPSRLSSRTCCLRSAVL